MSSAPLDALSARRIARCCSRSALSLARIAERFESERKTPSAHRPERSQSDFPVNPLCYIVY